MSQTCCSVGLHFGIPYKSLYPEFCDPDSSKSLEEQNLKNTMALKIQVRTHVPGMLTQVLQQIRVVVFVAVVKDQPILTVTVGSGHTWDAVPLSCGWLKFWVPCGKGIHLKKLAWLPNSLLTHIDSTAGSVMTLIKVKVMWNCVHASPMVPFTSDRIIIKDGARMSMSMRWHHRNTGPYDSWYEALRLCGLMRRLTTTTSAFQSAEQMHL